MGITTINGNKYFKSRDVKVFPASFRGHYTTTGGDTLQFDPEARLTTEFNFTHMSSTGNLQDSYIVSWNTTAKILKCVIGGYYFEISNIIPADFVNGTTIDNLYIRLSDEIVLKPEDADKIDCKRTTKVLASDFYSVFTGGTDLDREFATTKAADNGYYFTGLGIGENLTGDANLAVVMLDSNGTAVANPASLLPNIKSGTGCTNNKTTSIKEGFNTIASNSCTHAGGNTSTASGENSFAYGHVAVASALNTVAFGDNNTASKEAAFVVGKGNTASGKYSFAGGNSTTASGECTVTFGYNNTANGKNAIAVGNTTKATKACAYANGTLTEASGENATAIGNYTIASGKNSYAEGSGSSTNKVIASEEAAHAEGKQTVASGIAAHAEGYSTTAKHLAAHAGGYNTETTTNYQTVIGAYNDNATNSSDKDALFVVGNGHAKIGTETEDLRQNAFAVLTDTTNIRTNTNVYGNLIAEGNNILLQNTAGQSLQLTNGNTTIKNTNISLVGITNITGTASITGDLNITGNISATEKITAGNGFEVTTGGALLKGDEISLEKNADEYLKINSNGLAGKAASISLTGDTTITGKLTAIGATISIGSDNNNKIAISNTGNDITGEVFINSIKTSSGAGTYAVSVGEDGKLVNKNLSKNNPTPEAETDGTKTITYINSIKVESDGEITATAKQSTIADGISQGTFKLNNKEINVGGLGTDADVDFQSITLTDGGLTLATAKTGTIAFKDWIIGEISNEEGELCFQNGTAYKLRLNSEGMLSAVSFCATSDKRLKENIIEYKSKKSILDLPVYKYDFINGPKNQIGCLAQDLQEVCPELVSENSDGYLSIQESKLVYLLLDEIKVLKNRIQALEEK